MMNDPNARAGVAGIRVPMTRPTDAELVTLLREARTLMFDALVEENDPDEITAMDRKTGRMGERLRDAADALSQPAPTPTVMQVNAAMEAFVARFIFETGRDLAPSEDFVAYRSAVGAALAAGVEG